MGDGKGGEQRRSERLDVRRESGMEGEREKGREGSESADGGKCEKKKVSFSTMNIQKNKQ